MSLFSIYSWRIVLLHIELRMTILCSQCLENVLYFWLPRFQMTTLFLFELVFPFGECIVSFWMLSRIFSSSICKTLIVQCSGVNLGKGGGYPIWDFIQLLESVGVYFLPNLEIFKSPFLLILFQTYSLFPFFLDNDVTNVVHFCYCATNIKALCLICFQSVFPLFVRLSKF